MHEKLHSPRINLLWPAMERVNHRAKKCRQVPACSSTLVRGLHVLRKQKLQIEERPVHVRKLRSQVGWYWM